MKNPSRTQGSIRFGLIALSALIVACAKDKAPASSGESPGAEGSASVSATAEVGAKAETKVSIAPTLGGSVLAVGEYQVEVAVHDNGLVKGLVFDARSKPLSNRAALDFAVTLHTAAGAEPKVDLLWNDECACFSGQATFEGALAPRPIDVSLAVNGDLAAAKLEAYALLPAPRVEVNANVKASAQADLPEPPKMNTKLGVGAKGLAGFTAPKVELKAPSLAESTKASASATAKASANVSAPKPAVQLKVNTTTPKPKAGASVKGGASFGFGTK